MDNIIDFPKEEDMPVSCPDCGNYSFILWASGNLSCSNPECGLMLTDDDEQPTLDS